MGDDAGSGVEVKARWGGDSFHTVACGDVALEGVNMILARKYLLRVASMSSCPCSRDWLVEEAVLTR